MAISKFQINQLKLQLNSIFDCSDITIATKDYTLVMIGKNGYNPKMNYSIGHNHPKTILLRNNKYNIAISEVGQTFQDAQINRADVYPAYEFKQYFNSIEFSMPLWLREAQLIKVYWGMPKREWYAYMSGNGVIYSLEQVLTFPGEPVSNTAYCSDIVHTIGFGYDKPSLSEIESVFQFRHPDLDVTVALDVASDVKE
jgi:hypothetical protein